MPATHFMYMWLFNSHTVSNNLSHPQWTSDISALQRMGMCQNSGTLKLLVFRLDSSFCKPEKGAFKNTYANHRLAERVHPGVLLHVMKNVTRLPLHAANCQDQGKQKQSKSSTMPKKTPPFSFCRQAALCSRRPQGSLSGWTQ